MMGNIPKYITNNCQTNNHKWCKSKTKRTRWGICQCDCHDTVEVEK